MAAGMIITTQVIGYLPVSGARVGILIRLIRQSSIKVLNVPDRNCHLCPKEPCRDAGRGPKEQQISVGIILSKFKGSPYEQSDS